jgi:hypothetical protein
VVGTGSISSNAYKADGDGKYDILIEFPSGPPSARFSVGDTSVFTLTNAGGLTPDDFKFLSLPDGGNGPFFAAAHVQATGTDGKGSGWVAPAVPEPSSLAVAGLGALGLAGYGLRRRSR